ncbi:MAG TPA: type II secretion system F family protein [Xanthomonadales bacterium]|nr:type II secretion system F family protein [Xanthomonadales bacterium]
MATATARAKAPANRGLGELQTFHWEGTDKRGQKLKGEELGKNANLVKANLRKQGINATKVAQKRTSIFGKQGAAIKPRDIAVVSRQLATMMKAGVPMVQSFEMIAGGQSNPRLKDMLTAIKSDVEGGSSLSESLNKFPAYFDELFVNLVRAGESAGVLDVVLDTIATYKENIESLKGKIKKALFYPAAVIAVAILVSSVILIYVVPQFESVFQSFGSDLPAFTQMIVNASKFLVAYWWLMLAVVVGSVFAFTTALRRSRNFARLIDRMMLRLPVIGQILHNSAVARFARTLAITFRAGVPLVEALETVAGATGNIIYDEATKRIKEDVSVGHQLNLAMKQVNLFPLMVIQMTAIGEESGALDTMLVKAAEFYEQEVNNSVDALSTLLEPFIMVIIGVLVGGMVIGMYLPIFKLGAVV